MTSLFSRAGRRKKRELGAPILWVRLSTAAQRRRDCPAVCLVLALAPLSPLLSFPSLSPRAYLVFLTKVTIEPDDRDAHDAIVVLPNVEAGDNVSGGGRAAGGAGRRPVTRPFLRGEGACWKGALRSPRLP